MPPFSPLSPLTPPPEEIAQGLQLFTQLDADLKTPWVDRMLEEDEDLKRVPELLLVLIGGEWGLTQVTQFSKHACWYITIELRSALRSRAAKAEKL